MATIPLSRSPAGTELRSSEYGVLQLTVAAHLARYKGMTRTHTDADLRMYLRWCASQLHVACTASVTLYHLDDKAWPERHQPRRDSDPATPCLHSPDVLAFDPSGVRAGLLLAAPALFGPTRLYHGGSGQIVI